MKVIIIKDNKDGKVNDIIEVSSGYATNFLIKKGLALPLNSKTEHMLNNKKAVLQSEEEAKILKANKAKKVIEALTLKFNLKVTNMVVHGSITKKQINKELVAHGIKVDTHNIENVKIASLGISKVSIKLHKDITATLKVEVSNG